MDDQARLMQGIHNEPGDKTLRLIYADCLEETDDTERADVIRMMLKHPSLTLVAVRYYPSDPIQMSTFGTASEPMAAYVKMINYLCDWLFSYLEATIPNVWCFSVQMQQGFLTTISMRMACWTSGGYPLVSDHPLTHVTLEQVEAAHLYPLRLGGMFGYRGCDFSYYNISIPGNVFFCLWDCLEGGIVTKIDGDPASEGSVIWKFYRSRELAVQALSRACIVWAKKKLKQDAQALTIQQSQETIQGAVADAASA